MTLDKAIKYGKEHRKGYAERGKPGRYDLWCRRTGNARVVAVIACSLDCG